MHCVKCGAALSDGAAFCPNCGAATTDKSSPAPPAEPKKKSNKLLGCLGIGVGVIILLAVIGSLAPDRPATSNGSAPAASAADTAPEDLPLAVTATELFNAYENNEASAQGYFGDRKLLVSGTVDKVILDFMDNPVVLLKTPNQFMSAQAALADDAHGQASGFNPGNKVQLLCEGVSEVVSTPMIKDCRTAPAGTKSQPIQ